MIERSATFFGCPALRFSTAVYKSREHSAMVRRWDHVIHLRAAPDDRTFYSDDVDIDAGLLTPLVWAFAQWFYRHRQRRWRRIARQLASAGLTAGETIAET